MMKKQTIIIDSGSGTIKAGFVGDKEPRAVFPTIIGFPNPSSTIQDFQVKSEYIGDVALQKSDILNLHNPFASGMVE